MNYGHTGNQNVHDDVPDFFTSGAGTNSENLNDVEPENNLDLSSNGAASWSNERDTRSIGDRAINSIENASAQNAINPNNSEQLAEIIDLEMPPVHEGETQRDKSGATTTSHTPVIAEDIKTTDKLNTAGIKEVDRILSKLDRDGDITNFYDTARDHMEKNLFNSFNRKVGQ